MAETLFTKWHPMINYIDFSLLNICTRNCIPLQTSVNQANVRKYWYLSVSDIFRTGQCEISFDNPNHKHFAGCQIGNARVLQPVQVSQCQCHCHPFSISVSAGNAPRFFLRLLSYGLKRLSLPPPLLPTAPLVVVLVLFHSNTGMNGVCAYLCVCVDRCVRALLVRKSKLMLMPGRARWPKQSPAITIAKCDGADDADGDDGDMQLSLRQHHEISISRMVFEALRCTIRTQNQPCYLYMYLLLDEDDCWVWYGCSGFLVANARVNWLTWCITFGLEYVLLVRLLLQFLLDIATR